MRPLKYIIWLLCSALLLISVVFFINILFDPLWYINGNQIEHINYAFNERLSKSNQFLNKNPSHNYNCIIFGSSRTTLFNESLLSKNFNCFNFSFSAGRVAEFNAYANWLKKKGIIPKIVIIGIDDFNFSFGKKSKKLATLDFVSDNENPPNIFRSYISLDALKMSYRLYRNKSPNPKMYDENFIGTLVQKPPKYKPSLSKNKKTLTISKDVISATEKYRMLLDEAAIAEKNSASLKFKV